MKITVRKIMNRNLKKKYPVEGWIEIVELFLWLHKNKTDIYDCPLSIYYNKTMNSIKNITDFIVSTEMWELAKEPYQMDNKEPKSLLCHLLQVGACCALYSQGVQKEEIKQIKWWKIDSWEEYLCNLLCITEQQIMTMCKADEIPNFL